MHSSIKSYIRLFENLSEELISKMDEYVAMNVTFKDPFNEVHNLSSLQLILRKTLLDVQNPQFLVLRTFEEDGKYILKWRFSGKVPVIGLWEVEGLSEIYLNEEGKIAGHIDYWDASENFYMRIPVLGSLLGKIRQRLQV
ncbi:hypothetical protein [Curvivirga sp.]|uniref:hypothetical protein n=1 Tax=Curvivirga sp. TaxID=2856848 RepID=UPI003B5960DD